MKLLNRYIVGLLCLIVWLSSCQNEQDIERYEALFATYTEMTATLAGRVDEVKDSREYDRPLAMAKIMQTNYFEQSLFYISSLERTIFEQKKVTNQQWSLLGSLLKQDYKRYATLGDSLQLIFEQYRDTEAVERCLNQYHEQLAAIQHPLFLQIETPNFIDDIKADADTNAVKTRLAQLQAMLYLGELNRLQILLDFMDEVAMSSIEDETPYDWLMPQVRWEDWTRENRLKVKKDSVINAELFIYERYRPQSCKEAYIIANNKDTLPIDENGYAYFEQYLDEKGEHFYHFTTHIKCPQARFYNFEEYGISGFGTIGINVE